MPSTLFGTTGNHQTGGGAISKSGPGTMIWSASMTGNPPGLIGRQGGSASDILMVHASLFPGAKWWRHKLLGSDHLPLFLELQVKPCALKERNLKLKWNWQEANWEAFCKEVDLDVDSAVPRSSKWSLKRKVNYHEVAIMGSARRNVGMVCVKGEGRKCYNRQIRLSCLLVCVCGTHHPRPETISGLGPKMMAGRGTQPGQGSRDGRPQLHVADDRRPSAP